MEVLVVGGAFLLLGILAIVGKKPSAAKTTSPTPGPSTELRPSPTPGKTEREKHPATPPPSDHHGLDPVPVPEPVAPTPEPEPPGPGDHPAAPVPSKSAKPGDEWVLIESGDNLSLLAKRAGLGATSWRLIRDDVENAWIKALTPQAMQSTYGLNLVPRYGRTVGVDCVFPGYKASLLGSSNGQFPVLHVPQPLGGLL